MESNRWSQTELAARIGISQPTINKLINTNIAPSLETLQKFSKFLNIPIAELLGETIISDELANAYAKGILGIRKIPQNR